MRISKHLSILAASVTSMFILAAQTSKPKMTQITGEEIKLETRELNIGDRVPNFQFSLLNYPSKKGKLSDFKGKFVILDFWATWCTSCLKHFPDMDIWQKKYGNKLQILLITTKNTGDDEKKVIAFFDKRKNLDGKKFCLPSIVYDSIANALFPHKMIPHYAWINADGVVQAITSSDQVSEKNIESFINGEELHLPVKKDLDFDNSKPLFVGENGGKNETYIYRSFLTRHLEGLPSTNGSIIDKNKLVHRQYAINVSILNLYQLAYPEINSYPENRVLLEVKYRSKYTCDDDWEAWKFDNTYSYELITPPASVEEVRVKMQEDLKRFFGLNVYTEKRKVNCLILKYHKINNNSKPNIGVKETNIYDKDNLPKYLRNYPIASLVGWLNTILDTPLIDETEVFEKMFIEGLPSDLRNIDQLKKCLSKYGFEITEEQRELQFFILSEKNSG